MESHEAANATCLRPQTEVLLRFETGRDHGALPDLRSSSRRVLRPARSGRESGRGPVAPAGAVRGDGDHRGAEGHARAVAPAAEAREGEAGTARASLRRVPATGFRDPWS